MVKVRVIVAYLICINVKMSANIWLGGEGGMTGTERFTQCLGHIHRWIMLWEHRATARHSKVLVLGQQ